MNTTGLEAASAEGELLIRRLTPADAGIYRALRLRGLAEHPDAFTSSAEDEAKRPLATTEARIAPDSLDAVFGAFAGSVLAGVTGLARESRAKNRHKATVFGMYVAPEFARRGVGRALIRHVVGVAQGHADLEQLVLTVTQTNDAARALYESEGFRSFGIEPRAICVAGRYYDKNHMVRFLDRP